MDTNEAIADVAVEARLFSSEYAEIAFAFMLASMMRSSRAGNLEILAHRCGITEALAWDIVLDANRAAELLGAGHRFLKDIADLGLGQDVHRLIDLRRKQQRAARARP